VAKSLEFAATDKAPASTSFADNTIDLPQRNFLSPELGAEFQRVVHPDIWRYLKFTYKTV